MSLATREYHVVIGGLDMKPVILKATCFLDAFNKYMERPDAIGALINVTVIVYYYLYDGISAVTQKKEFSVNDFITQV